jgi:N-acetylmuramoyl-L-alanine amidase
MKRTRSVFHSVWRYLVRLFSLVFHPRHALPCVGLVVLGGCLTLIITPDEDATALSPIEAASEFPLVVLDPGHGGKDDGTMWRGMAERHLSLDLAFRVERLLKSSGFRTLLTRRDDTFVSLDERARIANAQRDAIFVSLHFNSESTTTSSGIETFYAKTKEVPVNDWSWVGIFNKGEQIPTDTSETLAGAIQTSLVMRTEARNRGIHPSKFYVVHHTRCPSVLVEAGFISNPFEAQLLSTNAYRETLAKGIAEGILQYQKTRQQEAPAAEQKDAELAQQ